MERPLTPSRRGAFTLLELLVAMAVVSIFVVIAVELAAATLKRAEGVNSKLRANMQARVVMDWLARDLQTSLVRRDGGEWLRMEPTNLAVGSLSLPMSRLMLFSQAGELHLSSAGSTTVTNSGPAAVSYETDYCDPITLQANRWNTTALFRVTVEPQETFDNGFAAQTPYNLADDFWDSLPTGVGQREAQHLLIQNIAGFEIAFEFTTNGPTTIKSDPNWIFSAGVDGNVRAGNTTYPGATVLSAEVTLWLLEPEGARALRRAAEGASVTTADFLAKYAHPFVRKIPLQTQ